MSETILQDISLRLLLLNDSANDYLVGEIIMWPNTTSVPYNCLSCNGQELSKTSYQELFDIIGTKYGENGSKFLLPNLNNNGLSESDSLLMKGIATMSGTSSVSTVQFYDSINYGYGNNSIDINQIPSHNHSITNNRTNNIIYNVSLGNYNEFSDNNSGGNQLRHANRTVTTSQLTDDGGGETSAGPDSNHTHNIAYNNNSVNHNESSGNVSYLNNLLVEYNVSFENNINNQKNYKPIHTKVNYIICYTK